MTLSRRLAYAVAMPLLRVLVWLLWRSCRVQPVQGSAIVDNVLSGESPYVPCFWHRDILVVLLTIRTWIRPRVQSRHRHFCVGGRRSTRPNCTILGATVIRGSASKTGALAMPRIFMVS